MDAVEQIKTNLPLLFKIYYLVNENQVNVIGLGAVNATINNQECLHVMERFESVRMLMDGLHLLGCTPQQKL